MAMVLYEPQVLGERTTKMCACWEAACVIECSVRHRGKTSIFLKPTTFVVIMLCIWQKKTVATLIKIPWVYCHTRAFYSSVTVDFPSTPQFRSELAGFLVRFRTLPSQVSTSNAFDHVCPNCIRPKLEKKKNKAAYESLLHFVDRSFDSSLAATELKAQMERLEKKLPSKPYRWHLWILYKKKKVSINRWIKAATCPFVIKLHCSVLLLSAAGTIASTAAVFNITLILKKLRVIQMVEMVLKQLYIIYNSESSSIFYHCCGYCWSLLRFRYVLLDEDASPC